MVKRIFVFAHGSGVGSKSPWMQQWAERLSALGEVHSFDYPYMAAGRTAPPKAEKLIPFHEQEAVDALSGSGAAYLYLIGKSMGSRVGAMVASSDRDNALPIAGVICFGYPLVGAKQALRDGPVKDLRSPILFIQGTKDSMCPLDALERVRREAKVATSVHVVDTANHSLAAQKTWMKSRGWTQTDVDDNILSHIRAFVEAVEAKQLKTVKHLAPTNCDTILKDAPVAAAAGEGGGGGKAASKTSVKPKAAKRKPALKPETSSGLAIASPKAESKRKRGAPTHEAHVSFGEEKVVGTAAGWVPPLTPVPDADDSHPLTEALAACPGDAVHPRVLRRSARLKR